MFGFVLSALMAFQSPVDYQIAAVRAPRYGDTTYAAFQEVNDPIKAELGTDLVLINPDRTEEVLVPGGDGACADPCPSLDGTWVYYAKIGSLKDVNSERRNGGKLSRQGADIFKINVITREIVQLTHQEWTPNTGVAKWTLPDPSNRAKLPGTYLGYGIYNLGPCVLPSGRVMFTSSRNGFLSPKAYTFPNLQLFTMDANGQNVEEIGFLNIGSALHPTLLMNGEVAFSSYETQGYRGNRSWGLWSIWPDGRQWGPLVSAFAGPDAFHFQTQLSDGRVVVVWYYNGNNNGFGTAVAFNEYPPPSLAAGKRFGSPTMALNPPFKIIENDGVIRTRGMLPFQPNGLICLTQFANSSDQASYLDTSSVRMGKVTHPSGAPNNDLLLVWSGNTASNNLSRPVYLPRYQGQIALLRGGLPVTHPSQLTILKSNPAYNYQQPRALVPYAAIYGKQPAAIPESKNDGTVHPALPRGTPFGLIGTSSFLKRDSAPGQVTLFGNPSNWFQQGSDSGKYDNSEIWSVRIVETVPQSHLSYRIGGTPTFGGHDRERGWTVGGPANERLRIIGEVPLRKFNQDGLPIMDVDGNPDTSFLAKIPADVPFTFQTLDRNGMVLNQAQTWHQVRPGEVRNDCGGCHAHSQVGTDFAVTFAARPDYAIADLTKGPARTVEFVRDVKPILDAHCTACHGQDNQSGMNLQAADTYTQLLKRVVPLRSRESLLAWKIYGRTLDGSGTPMAGTEMPPSGDSLTDAEKRTITTWIDLGAGNGPGLSNDDLRPTLTIQSPRRDEGASTVVIGACDSDTGLNRASLSVKLDGVDITSLFSELNGVWSGTLAESKTSGVLIASVADVQGNVMSMKREFSGTVPPPVNPTEKELLIAQLAVIQKQIDALAAQLADLAAQKTIIQAKIDALP